MKLILFNIVISIFTFSAHAETDYVPETSGAGESPVQHGQPGMQICPESQATGNDQYFADLARSADPEFDERQRNVRGRR